MTFYLKKIKMVKTLNYLIIVLLLITHISCANSRGEKTVSQEEESPENVRFMTFNIWQEGTSVANGIDKIRDVIVNVSPDVVCFTEVRNYNNQDWTTKIVEKLKAKGYHYLRGYAGGDVSLISKFPIVSSELIVEGEESIAMFELLINEKAVKVACAHLDYTSYACYLPRGYYGGIPNWGLIEDNSGEKTPVTNVDEISLYNLTSRRDEQIASFIAKVENEIKPVILMGDFNEPSHFDWTKKTAHLFDHNGVIINWSTTYALYQKGYIDAYRDYFPDEVLNPGITWPSKAHGKGSTSWTPMSDERDRIDFIFYKGDGIKTIYASLVGPKESYANGALVNSYTKNENFIAETLDWPSDHKAVLVTLKLSN